MDGLFCTPIYRSVIPDSLYGFFTSSEKQFFKDLKRKVKKNVGNVNTIDTYVLENKKLLFLKQKVMEHVNVYFDQVYAPKQM
mgnify:FL=1